ncbi:MAG: hypothetical protein F4Z01_06500 [Gammaproteobacteria bacterium]|nr:hypothetical protein [Gammaproteobacteria bacterium]MYF38754.1 hypothetical protein [Gammaproteobacteria bacterium]
MRKLWRLAVAEMRSCRRLTRTWIFISVAILICTGWYVYMLGDASWPHPPAQWYYFLTNPGYEISAMMKFFVVISLCAIILLVFDFRARDVRSRIHEVMDSLPASNLEIVFGRLAGVFLLLLIPCLIFLALVGCYETIALANGLPYRMGVLPISVLSQVAWNLVPNLILFCVLVAFLATLVRSPFVVASIALGLLAGLYWLDGHIPVRFQESVSPFVGNTLVPSDLAPEFVTPNLLGSRCVLLFLSLALLLFAASLLPRIAPQRTRYLLSGGAAFGIAILTYGGLIAAVYGDEKQRATWVDLHQQESPTAFPDIQHLAGSIDLRPGRYMELNVSLTVLSPTANVTDSVVFSLNPSLTIHKLTVDGTETTNFSFKSGLLKISTGLFTEPSHEIGLQAKGRPDDRFAYLDQARDFKKLTNQNVARLGLRNSIFHRDYVALMPGIVWYPISGTITDQKLEQRAKDLFTTDLTISVPQNWQVATVGKRAVIEQRPRKKVQIINQAPVPEIALLAANFDQRTSSIEGVDFEVLFSKKHLQNLDSLSPIANLVREWVAGRIQRARALSLNFPYDTFSVVEIPSNLRIYGGGWQMDSVLQPPGMMLIRETTFPTSSFENLAIELQQREATSTSGQEEQVFKELLIYFCNDMQGGNPFAGFARNFVSHQVSVGPRGAISLQYLIEQLSNQLIMQTESLSLLSASKFDARIPNLWISGTPLSQYVPCGAPTGTREDIAVLPSTWEVMDQTALIDHNFSIDPIASYRVLLTKGHALAQSLITHYGAENIGRFLHQAVTNYQGQNLSTEELSGVAAEVGINFEQFVLPWLEGSALPGFIVDSPSVSMLNPSEQGFTEYQTTFRVHNAETLWGYFHVFWEENDEDVRSRAVPGPFSVQSASSSEWPYVDASHSDPIFLAGHQSKQITIQSSKRVSRIWIAPFLAHNRAPFEVLIPQDQENLVQELSPVPIATDVQWQPQKSEVVIVDDLDPNFSIVRKDQDSDDYLPIPPEPSQLREREFDRGLRVNDRPIVGEWSRLYDESSHGHYRRTATPIVRGDQTTAARFAAVLPHKGYWKLEFHVPEPVFGYDYFGGFTEFLSVELHNDMFRSRNANPAVPEEHYRLIIKAGNSVRNENFDIANASKGWNEVGSFEFDSTEVEVLFSAWAGHRDVWVFADAIRWTPTKTE